MRLRKRHKNEIMTMAHRADSSVVEHWSAVRRVPGSIPGQSILCINCQRSSAECDTWLRGQDPPTESLGWQ